MSGWRASAIPGRRRFVDLEGSELAVDTLFDMAILATTGGESVALEPADMRELAGILLGIAEAIERTAL